MTSQLSEQDLERARRLDLAIRQSGKTQEEIGTALGVSQGMIWQWAKGRRPVPATRAQALAAAVGIEDPALISAAYRVVAASIPSSNTTGSQAETFAEIPMWSARVGAAVSEPEAESELVGSLLFRPASLKRKRINAAASHVFYVSGDSMAPTIKDGAVVLFDTSDRTLRSGKLYVIAWSGERLVKRLFNEGGVVKVVSDNPSPAYPERVVQPDDYSFEIVGRVRWTASWED